MGKEILSKIEERIRFCKLIKEVAADLKPECLPPYEILYNICIEQINGLTKPLV